jgi:hypothetical protein
MGCGTLCVTHFEPTRFTYATLVRHVDSELSLFRHLRSARESMLMTRRLVRIRWKFWRHNPFRHAVGEQQHYATEILSGSEPDVSS